MPFWAKSDSRSGALLFERAIEKARDTPPGLLRAPLCYERRSHGNEDAVELCAVPPLNDYGTAGSRQHRIGIRFSDSWSSAAVRPHSGFRRFRPD